jgi:Protein of unknown function (DUF1116)
MELFSQELQVLNLGLATFADAISRAGGSVTQLEWTPPALGNVGAGRALATLVNDPAVEAANRAAFAAYLASQPKLEGVGLARELIPAMRSRLILHSGPPIAWERMCGPMQGAITGAILLEGWARDPTTARALAASGEVKFEPCHHHGAVGPMAGIISPSMPVFSILDNHHGHRTFSNINEGLGKVLRFGAFGADVTAHLEWMASKLYKVLEATFANSGGIELKPLMAQALHMGDELHNRNTAATLLLLRRLLPAMMASDASRADVAEVVAFIAGNDHFFLNISMAACKAMLDAARGFTSSSMVTTMARNGVEFGLQVSGTGDRWFTAPAPVVEGLFFPGYSTSDAAPDLGDSAITESVGLGAFAMAAAPAIVNFVGGTTDDAMAHTATMAHITMGRNGGFTLPALNFAGTPAGIDIRSVVDTGLLPVINTGIAHRQAGVGQIGAGITRAPLDCFIQALAALAAALPPPAS